MMPSTHPSAAVAVLTRVDGCDQVPDAATASRGRPDSSAQADGRTFARAAINCGRVQSCLCPGT